MTERDLIDEVIDMRAHVPFLRDLITAAEDAYDNQVARTTVAYGPDNRLWPAGSVIAISRLADALVDARRRLVEATAYLNELESRIPQQGECP